MSLTRTIRLAKTILLSDLHVPLDKLRLYAKHDTEMVLSMQKAWKEQQIVSDLCHLLAILGIKSAPRKWRVAIIDSIGDINE